MSQTCLKFIPGVPNQSQFCPRCLSFVTGISSPPLMYLNVCGGHRSRGDSLLRRLWPTSDCPCADVLTPTGHFTNSCCEHTLVIWAAFLKTDAANKIYSCHSLEQDLQTSADISKTPSNVQRWRFKSSFKPWMWTRDVNNKTTDVKHQEDRGGQKEMI